MPVVIMERICVGIEQDGDGYPPFDFEELDADELGDGRFRIVSIPVFVYGLARGDVVRASTAQSDGRLWAAEILEPNDHVTARVLPNGENTVDDVIAEFLQLGCHACAAPFGLAAIDVPGEVTPAAMDLLNEGQVTGRWRFDLGVLPARSGPLDPDPNDD